MRACLPDSGDGVFKKGTLMAITAQEIQEMGFENARKGYDVEEVDIFLEHVAEEVDKLNRENSRLRAQIDELESALEAAESTSTAISPVVPQRDEETERRLRESEARVRAYENKVREFKSQISGYESQIRDLQGQIDAKGEDARTISSAIIAAQRSADAIRLEAREEGEKIYREAENKAREIVRDALSDKQQTLAELERLRDSRLRFKADYQDLLARFTEEAAREFSLDQETVERSALDVRTIDEEERDAFADVRAAAAGAVRYSPSTYDPEDIPEPPVRTRPSYTAQLLDTTSFERVGDYSGYGDVDDDDDDIDFLD